MRHFTLVREAVSIAVLRCASRDVLVIWYAVLIAIEPNHNEVADFVRSDAGPQAPVIQASDPTLGAPEGVVRRNRHFGGRWGRNMHAVGVIRYVDFHPKVMAHPDRVGHRKIERIPAAIPYVDDAALVEAHEHGEVIEG